MAEKLKYKVGDKVLIEMEVVRSDRTSTPYQLETSSGIYMGWISEENLEKSVVNLPPKPKIPQAVMDWCETKRAAGMIWKLAEWFDSEDMPVEVSDWLFTGADLLLKQHALATLIAYGPEAVEVEKEKKYRVKLKATEQYLKRYAEGIIFSGIAAYVEVEYYKHFKFTKQELIDTGFESVFDNLMFEVEEVE